MIGIAKQSDCQLFIVTYKGNSMILFKTESVQNPESKFYLLHELLWICFTICPITLSSVGPTYELKGRIEYILRIWKENHHEKWKVIDILHNWCSLMSCITQAWHSIVERLLGSEASCLDMSSGFAIYRLSVLK